MLTEFADNPTILAWDLKNEPNSDYDAAGREVVNAWLAHTARLAHEYAPNHLITIGWLSPQAAQSLTEYVDLISFHYYGLASELSASCDALRAVAPDHPIALTEFGLPTWNSFFFPHGHSEPEQTEYYADILTALRESGGAGYLAWTLYDFEHVPSSVTGRFPWQKGPQKNLGLIRVDGEPKAAAALLAPDASLEVIHVPEWSRFLKPFWLTVMISALLGLLVLIKGVSYWYKSRYSQK